MSLERRIERLEEKTPRKESVADFAWLTSKPDDEYLPHVAKLRTRLVEKGASEEALVYFDKLVAGRVHETRLAVGEWLKRYGLEEVQKHSMREFGERLLGFYKISKGEKGVA